MHEDTASAIAASTPSLVLFAFICVHLRFHYFFLTVHDDHRGNTRSLSARVRATSANARAAVARCTPVRHMVAHVVHLVRYHAGTVVARHLGSVRHPAPDDPAEPRSAVAR